jgi:hypothetical protein
MTENARYELSKVNSNYNDLQVDLRQRGHTSRQIQFGLKLTW